MKSQNWGRSIQLWAGLMAGIVLSASAAAKTWDGGDGLWTDSAWDGGGAPPGPADDAVLPPGTYTVTVSGALSTTIEVANLTIQGGVLTCTGIAAFAVSGDVSIDTGAMRLISDMAVPSELRCGGDLTLDNGGTLDVYASMTNAAYPDYGARVWVADRMTLTNNSWVHLDLVWKTNTLNTAGSTLFQMNSLEIADGSGFNANLGGYATGQPGKGYGPGGGYPEAAGAGYGGYGGGNNPGYGTPYGSYLKPTEPGSSGYYRSGHPNVGRGGGAIWIECTNRVTLNGTLTANGESVTGFSGAGSGGGIYVRCQTIASQTGRMRAKGGSTTVDYNPGAGGGGRIALAYDKMAQSNAALGATIQFEVDPGFSARTDASADGTPGSIYLPDEQLYPQTWHSGGRFYFDAPVTLTHPGDLTASYRLVEFAVPAVFSVGGDLTCSVTEGSPFASGGIAFLSNAVVTIGGGATLYRSALRFNGGGTGRCEGDLLVNRGSVVMGTNFLVAGHLSLTNSTTTLYGLTNMPPRLICGGHLTLDAASALYVYGSITNADHPDYGGLVQVAGALTLMSNSWIYPRSTDPTNSAQNLGGTKFAIGSLTVSSNSGFNADASGYGGRPSAGVGYGPGGGGPKDSNGAGHGGLGGGSTPPYGQIYGVTNAPIHPGSEGYRRSTDHNPPGYGGGVIWIESAGTAQVDGRLTANALRQTGYNGAGSGGGILLACRTFLPSETTRLSADGGDVTINYNMGGGGGGRIAVWTGEISSENRARLIAGLPVIQGTLVVSGAFPGLSESQATVAGGEVVDAPERNGGDGTIVFLKILPPPGTLIMVR